jgi:UbiD family decarboxylase
MNLRAFLQDLESKSPEEIWRIPAEVEPTSDITALVLELERRGGYPVLRFERVRGSRFPVVANVFPIGGAMRAPSGCPGRACTTNG